MDVYNSVNDMWFFFKGILLDCLNTFAPAKSIRCKSSHHCPTPWLSPSLLEAIKKKQQAKRKAERTGVSDDIKNYRRLKITEYSFSTNRPRFLMYNRGFLIQGGIPIYLDSCGLLLTLF